VDEERQTIRELGIKAYGMSEIERLGISQICEETFTRMNESTDGFVLSFDIDALDPLFAPAVDYPQPGGLTTREAMVIMEFAHRAPGLKLLEILEVNPEKDVDQATSRLAVELIHRVIRGPVI
jgi:arginase